MDKREGGAEMLSKEKDSIIKNNIELHEKELKLLEFIRRLGYGEILIKVQDGLPVMIERATEKIKL